MSSRHSLTERGRRKRVVLKRFIYFQLALRSAVMIALGKEKPLVRFTVEDDPPSVYLAFVIRPDAADDLAARLELPPGMELTAIRCLEGDEPRLLMVLNVYRVSGITNGRRAEWSVFVAEPDGTPRYMVIDARSSSRSMDPMDLFTTSSRVKHARAGDRIEMTIGPDGHTFAASLDVSTTTPAVNDRAWVTANDRIYWGNGICDRTFYDAGLANATTVSIPLEAVDVTDDSPWSEFLESDPVTALMFTEAIEFVISPWENVEDLEI